MALMAVAKNVQVSAIFHSGILRARQTAEILAEHLQFNLGVKQLSGLLPQDDPAVAKGELEAVGESHHSGGPSSSPQPANSTVGQR